MNPDRVSVIQASCLQRWGTTPPQLIPPCAPAQAPRYTECPFPVNETLNNKICVWEGDITLLDSDGIIAGTNEYSTPRISFTDRVFHRARRKQDPPPPPPPEVLDVGEVKVVQEPSVVAKYLIYTVGPKFKPRYRAISDNSLHKAYKNVLDKARQLGLSTVGLGVIQSSRRNYPSNYGAHIALRTLRRYLEHYPNAFNIVVLVVDPYNHGLYERVLPLYFPRSPLEEEAACWKLPSPLGGQWGEPIIDEGDTRIIENPQNIFDDEDEDPMFGQKKQISDHPFTRMESDLDTERLLGGRQMTFSTGDPILDLIMKDFEERGRYERMLRRARCEDLTDIAKLGCIYQNGTDRLGRPVIIFIGKWFKVQETNLNKFFLYLISFLDYLVNHDYVMVYFHTKTTQANRPGLKWFTSVYNILPYKYKKNLKAVYIVHPSFWTKSLTWWFTKFMAPAIKQKIHTISGVEYLYSIIVPSELEIPAFITEYDISINGVCYYKPQQPLPEEDEFDPIPSTSVLRASISEPQPSTSGFGGYSNWEPLPLSSMFGSSTWEMHPSTSGLRSTKLEPLSSTSGLGSSTIEPVPSTSGLSTSAREKPETSSDDGTSTWELRPSPSGYRFSKLGPRPSKPQQKADPWELEEEEPSISQVGAKVLEPEILQPEILHSGILEPKTLEPQPGPSTSKPKPDPWTLQSMILEPTILEPTILEPQPGPSTSQPKPDPWTLQKGPSASKVGLSTSRSEPMGWEPQLSRSTSQPKPGPSVLQPQPGPSMLQPQPGPSTSQPKPDPWTLQQTPSTSRVGLPSSRSEPTGWELQPGPSTSQPKTDPWKPQPSSSASQPKSAAPDPQPGPATSKPQTEKSSSKSADSKKKSTRKKKSAVGIASTFV